MHWFSFTHFLVSISFRLSIGHRGNQLEKGKRLCWSCTGGIPSHAYPKKGVGDHASSSHVISAQRLVMFLLAITVVCSPLCSSAASQMYKQMESRRLVPTNEDVLFHQNHTDIGLMLMGLYTVSQMTEPIYLLSS